MNILLVIAFLALAANSVVSQKVIVKTWCTSKVSKLLASDYYFYTTVKCPIPNAPTDQKLELTLISERSDNRCNERSYRISKSGAKFYISVKNGCDGYFQVTVAGDKGTGPATWNKWSQWSTCNKQCRSTRTRTCSTGKDEDCQGNAEESQVCSGGLCQDKQDKDSNSNHNMGECGVANPTSGFRVVGGTRAGKCQYPWMVMVFNYATEEICGGSILDKRHILTAAHCVLDLKDRPYSPSSFEVYSGSSKVPLSLKGLKVQKPEKIIHHSNYRFTNKEIRDDIAMIKLSKDLKFDNCHRPICLSNGSRAVQDGKDCRVMGWGLISNKQHKTATNLQWANEKAVTREYCREQYGRLASEKLFCAVGENEGACGGDSGGPFTCKHEDGKFYQYGLVSAGEPNECGLSYGLYLDIHHYLDWIVETKRRF